MQMPGWRCQQAELGPVVGNNSERQIPTHTFLKPPLQSRKPQVFKTVVFSPWKILLIMSDVTEHFENTYIIAL
jgi:hypothetical protein